MFEAFLVKRLSSTKCFSLVSFIYIIFIQKASRRELQILIAEIFFMENCWFCYPISLFNQLTLLKSQVSHSLSNFTLQPFHHLIIGNSQFLFLCNLQKLPVNGTPMKILKTLSQKK